MTTEEILLELDSAHHRLCEALGKDKPTLYSKAAAEIGRLLAERDTWIPSDQPGVSD